MKSFSLALFAAGASALNTSVVTAPTIPAAQKFTAGSATAGSLTFGW